MSTSAKKAPAKKEKKVWRVGDPLPPMKRTPMGRATAKAAKRVAQLGTDHPSLIHRDQLGGRKRRRRTRRKSRRKSRKRRTRKGRRRRTKRRRRR